MTACRLVDARTMPVYDLGVDHPFARDRQRPLFELLERHGLFDDAELLRPEPATEQILQTAHDPAYVDAVRRLSADDPDPEALALAPSFGLGTSDNPIAPGQHDAGRAIAGATWACVSEVMSGQARRAFNPTGGLHHALDDRASGFCIYNDLVVGIRRGRELGAERVLYVDFDVHHGDGVEFAFRDDPTVMTISFHEDPSVRFPGTGRITDLGAGDARGTTINAPLASFTADASWLDTVRAVLPPLARRFRPDLIVSQHGCDPHRDDPLAELLLTTAPMHEAARWTMALADELCSGRWVATGGGGYQPISVIPRVWSGVWAVMSGRELPDRVDAEWIAKWQPRAPSQLSTTFTDAPSDHPAHDVAAGRNRETVSKLLALLEHNP